MLIPVVFVTWLIKALLMHYGGLRLHRQALPFFLGLLVGARPRPSAALPLAAVRGEPVFPGDLRAPRIAATAEKELRSRRQEPGLRGGREVNRETVDAVPG